MLWYSDRPIDGRIRFESRVTNLIHGVRLHADQEDWDAVADFIGNNQAWSNGVKGHFAVHQHRKCAYCERFVTDYGDVEHYRPKTAIFTLEAKGEELQGLNNIRGRTYCKHPEQNCWNSGYWWLAYSWDNYLVACGRCNQNWKNALFPIDGGRPNRPTQGDENTETALLLDPYGDRDPAEHLTYTIGGAIAPFNDSNVGQATIDVCGLDRPSLMTSRINTYRQVERKLKNILEIVTNHPAGNERDQRMKPILEDIVEMGAAEALNAGMVRIMLFQKLEMNWDTVLYLYNRL